MQRYTANAQPIQPAMCDAN
uniref:Uncharacterized protein n=1 Tax=Anguilla anguilla TaxID=7936 RepID=A0A0E9VGT4_ANGAN